MRFFGHSIAHQCVTTQCPNKFALISHDPFQPIRVQGRIIKSAAMNTMARLPQAIKITKRPSWSHQLGKMRGPGKCAV